MNARSTAVTIFSGGRSMMTTESRDRVGLHEFRVRFGTRFSNAVLAPIREPLPPLRTQPAAPPQAEPPAPSATDSSADQRQSDLEQQLARDRERIEAVLLELQTASRDLKHEMAARLDQWQKAAVELALTIATKLLHREIAEGKFAVEALVEEMVGQLGEDVPVTVRLNPEDLELLERRLAGEPLLPGRDDPRVVADAALARGSCQIEGKEAMLLSEVTGQLQEIREQLLGSMGHAGP